MRIPRHLFALFLLAGLGTAAAAAEPSLAQFAATAKRAGLRVLEGEHLTLATDRPPRDGDGVADLPQIFDEAFAAWCKHFALDATRQRRWRALGCLMVDRERFRTAGLLPTGGPIPDFKNGFCAGGRFWLMDQSNPAYRRHLLLHEGVHAFMLTLRESTAPPWYTEGSAEYLATHRLGPDAAGHLRFIPTPIPQQAADVEQLGRIEQVRRQRAAHAAPALSEVFQTPPAAHHDLAAYAASWAAVALLAGHPAHADLFSTAERGPLDNAFTQRLEGTPGWDAPRATRDFDAFTDDLDYGYDFARSAIDWSPGKPLASRQSIAVASDRGWQNSGWSLATNRQYALAAAGRYTIGATGAGGTNTTPAQTVLESEADGISLRWYRGRPVGRLLAAQWVEKPAAGGRPRFVVVAEGAASTGTALTDGPLYFKINESPGALADNAGSLVVELK